MSSVQGVGTPAIPPVTTASVSRSASTGAPALRASDRLESSGLKELLTHLKSQDVRVDKVAQVKAEIEAGTYENDAKLDAAIDKLLSDLE